MGASMPERNILTLGLVERHAPVDEASPESSAPWDKWAAYCETSGPCKAGLFEGPTERTRPSRFLCLGVSLVAQSLVVGLLVLRSVTAEAPLHEPQVVKTFIAVSPMVTSAPPPPPPLAKATAAVSEPRESRLVKPPRLDLSAFAITAPSVELDFGDSDFGVPEGIDDGVPGGVIGGLVGGLGEPTPPPAPAVERGPIRIAGTLGPPAKLVHVDPIYPDIAAGARVEGLVILEATIDGAGKVKDLRIIKSVPLLDDAATAAVRQWEYAPTIVAGNPVSILMTVTVTFSLAQYRSSVDAPDRFE